MDRHEHSPQGFYVATRLGDYVEIPTDQDDGVEGLENGVLDLPELEEDHAALAAYEKIDAALASYGEEMRLPASAAIFEDGDTATADGTRAETLKSGDTNEGGSDASFENKSSGTDDGVPSVSDMTLAGSKDALAGSVGSLGTGGGNKNGGGKKIASTADNVESDMLAALVPECGVPIPAVMAKVGTANSANQAVKTHRVKSGKGGMLLPWHSTRSIQNYHNHGRRGGSKKGKGGGSNTSLYGSGRSRDGSSTASIFSISSVHTFRG